MAKKTYSLDMNGATEGSGGITAPVGFEQTLDWNYIAGNIAASLNTQAVGYVVSGDGPFTIEQPEAYGNAAISVSQGTLDAAPILTVTQEWTPTVNVSVNDNTISEPSDESVAAFVIAAAHTLPVTVVFSLSGTATDGVDYTRSTTSPVEIAIGQTFASMSITATDDATLEPEETIIVSLGSITNGEVGTASEVTVFLTSDDSALDGGLLLMMGIG